MISMVFAGYLLLLGTALAAGGRLAHDAAGLFIAQPTPETLVKRVYAARLARALTVLAGGALLAAVAAVAVACAAWGRMA